MNIPPLCDASEKGNLADVIRGLENGADIHTRDQSFGYTPLHWASCNGHVETVKLLVAKKANIHSPDDDGWTPLHLAVSKSDSNMAKLLIQLKADLHQSDNDGWTPLRIMTGRRSSVATNGHNVEAEQEWQNMLDLQIQLQLEGQHLHSQEEHAQVAVQLADKNELRVHVQGQRVLYRNEGEERVAKIVKVHHDDTAPYYTVEFDNDATQRQTMREKLSPLVAVDGGEMETKSQPLSRQQRKRRRQKKKKREEREAAMEQDVVGEEGADGSSREGSTAIGPVRDIEMPKEADTKAANAKAAGQAKAGIKAKLDAQAKMEAEAKAKATADAKAKAAKVKVEAEAKVKAISDAKAKAAKVKMEEEAKAKAISDAKAKAAKVKAKAEAKAISDAKAKAVKIKLEAKAISDAKAKAAKVKAKAKAKAISDAKAKAVKIKLEAKVILDAKAKAAKAQAQAKDAKVDASARDRARVDAKTHPKIANADAILLDKRRQEQERQRQLLQQRAPSSVPGLDFGDRQLTPEEQQMMLILQKHQSKQDLQAEQKQKQAAEREKADLQKQILRQQDRLRKKKYGVQQSQSSLGSTSQQLVFPGKEAMFLKDEYRPRTPNTFFHMDMALCDEWDIETEEDSGPKWWIKRSPKAY